RMNEVGGKYVESISIKDCRPLPVLQEILNDQLHLRAVRQSRANGQDILAVEKLAQGIDTRTTESALGSVRNRLYNNLIWGESADNSLSYRHGDHAATTAVHGLSA